MNDPPDQRALDDIETGMPTSSTKRRTARATASEIEASLSLLSDARSILTPEKDAQKWAELSMDLGRLYSRRKVGITSENIELAIDCYNEALTVFEWKQHPAEWIECHSMLGKAYLDLSDGWDERLKKISLLHYKSALALLTKECSPTLWHTIHVELSAFFLKYATFSGNKDDAALSDEYYQMALDVDKDKQPDLYEWMKKLHDLYSELFEVQLEKGRAIEDDKVRFGGTDGQR